MFFDKYLCLYFIIYPRYQSQYNFRFHEKSRYKLVLQGKCYAGPFRTTHHYILNELEFTYRPRCPMLRLYPPNPAQMLKHLGSKHGYCIYIWPKDRDNRFRYKGVEALLFHIVLYYYSILMITKNFILKG